MTGANRWPPLAAKEAKEDLERRLREVIGLRTTVAPVGVRELDPHTGLSQTSKIKRLLDKRKVT